LPGLGQQDQRRGVPGLRAERQVEQDEGIRIPAPDHNAAFIAIQAATITVWTMMKCGVPKVLANDSASRPKLSAPKGAARCALAAWNRK
jgi:hypothetical protein